MECASLSMKLGRVSSETKEKSVQMEIERKLSHLSPASLPSLLGTPGPRSPFSPQPPPAPPGALAPLGSRSFSQTSTWPCSLIVSFPPVSPTRILMHSGQGTGHVGSPRSWVTGLCPGHRVGAPSLLIGPERERVGRTPPLRVWPAKEKPSFFTLAPQRG